VDHLPKATGPLVWSSSSGVRVSYITTNIAREELGNRLLFILGAVIGIIGALAAEILLKLYLRLPEEPFAADE
jgi:hypothetical protein